MPRCPNPMDVHRRLLLALPRDAMAQPAACAAVLGRGDYLQFPRLPRSARAWFFAVLRRIHAWLRMLPALPALFSSADSALIKDGMVQAFKTHAVVVDTGKREYILIPSTQLEYVAWVTTIASKLESRKVSPDLLSVIAPSTAAVPAPSASLGRAAGSAPAARSDSLDSLEDRDAAPAPLPAGLAPASSGGANRSSRTPSVLAEIDTLKTQRDAYAAQARAREAEVERMRAEVVMKSSLPDAGGSKLGSLNTSLLDDYEQGTSKRGNPRGRLETDEGDDGEAVGCCAACNCKVMYNVFMNSAIVLVGAGVLGVAIWAFAHRGAFKQLLGGTDFPLFVAMGVGAGLVLAAALGIYASTRHNTSYGRCLLFGYFIVICALVALQVAASITLIVMGQQVKSAADARVEHLQGETQAIRSITIFLNDTYTTCCLHYDAHGKGQECSWLPHSSLDGCHPHQVPGHNTTLPIESFQEWKSDLVKSITSNVAVLAGVWIGVILLQGLCAVSTFFLFRGGKGCPACCCCLCAMMCPGCCGRGDEDDDYDDSDDDEEAERRRRRARKRGKGKSKR